MAESLAAVTPIRRVPNDAAAVAVHAHLRSLILDGSLPPAAILNQVELAPRLGVSRTPLREAIRMLQEEGLVEAQPQKRARVVGFNAGLLEAVYVQRIALEAVAVRITVGLATGAQIDELVGLHTEMIACAHTPGESIAVEHKAAWDHAHRAFHRGLVSRAQPDLVRAITSQMELAERYLALSQSTYPGRFAGANLEHAAIVDAYREHDAPRAARALAEHLARTALALMAMLAPNYDPVALRAALAAA
jgi:DNA-binding GntR family transcriptional regulator